MKFKRFHRDCLEISCKGRQVIYTEFESRDYIPDHYLLRKNMPVK